MVRLPVPGFSPSAEGAWGKSPALPGLASRALEADRRQIPGRRVATALFVMASSQASPPLPIDRPMPASRKRAPEAIQS